MLDPRRYEEVEIEALQTVAMVLSELIANADLVDEGPTASRIGAPPARIAFSGLQLVMGMARAGGLSPAAHHDRAHVVAEDTSRRSATASIPPSTRCASRSTDGQPGRIRRRASIRR
jgi:phosphotransferase system enzyme I (PtsP)